MPKLLILGAGGHGKVVAEIASLMGLWEEISFLDDRKSLYDVIGFKVIGRFDDYMRFREEFTDAFVAIGNNQLRIKWLNALEQAGFKIPILKHPLSIISPTSHIEPGVVVMPGAVINASTKIGRGCIINTSSSIDHDSILEEGVHISPGAHLGGAVLVGTCSWICIGAGISNNIRIGKHSVVAAGSVVIEDIGDSVLVAGVPAKIKKFLE